LLHRKLDKFNLSKSAKDKDLWTFWKKSQIKLKNFWLAACEVAIIQPSSAFVERIFSVLRQAFDDTQEQALEDFKESSVMMTVNEGQREKEALEKFGGTTKKARKI